MGMREGGRRDRAHAREREREREEVVEGESEREIKSPLCLRVHGCTRATVLGLTFASLPI